MQGLSIHLDRKTENHSNEDIDIERSHLDYDLCEKEGDTLSRMNERLDEVYCMDRKDVKACCSWVVTLPENLKDAPDEHQRKFFEETYGFLADRYGGEKNVLSANVHNDETTPHMHFAFIPVVYDPKKEREKVSAKLVINRNELKVFHKDLDVHLKESIPEIYQDGILNDKTIGLDDIESIKKHSKEIEAKKADMSKELEEFSRKEKEEMVKDLATFKKPDEIIKRIDSTSKESLLGGKTNLITKDYKQLIKVAKSAIKEKQNLYNYKKVSSEKIGDLEATVRFADRKIKNLEGKNENLEKEVAGLQEHRINEIVFKSMLQDDNRDLNISQTEIDGRLILFNLENGHEPLDREQGERWSSTLEENKRLKTIPQSRLQRGLDKLKQFIEKFLVRGFSMDSVLQKVEQEKSRKPKNKKKSHDLEL
ncbi:Plasmid recombination enzyme [Metalysinibacillus saudimassiliensis]|uniref:Plasmid recombination enzyme n=1 Tax=Metalysinibacillus saudimassiliensis TaxID=1461583 RepID=A0A078MM73_9BACL|nr:Plasmid recombination enzyme [Metalysinibacillus saudimassiliensis]